MSKMTRLPYPGGSTSPGMSPFWVTIQIGARGEGFSAPLRALVDTDSMYAWMPGDVLEALGVTRRRTNDSSSTQMGASRSIRWRGFG